MTMTHSVNALGDATGVAECHAAAFGITEWLSLAATPTFAIMALLEDFFGREAPDVLCATGHGMSALSGMVPMYLLMSVFHSGHWLKLVARTPLKRTFTN
jgi:hypothetical protein